MSVTLFRPEAMNEEEISEDKNLLYVPSTSFTLFFILISLVLIIFLS